VLQEGSSTYKLVEASVGGRLSRHNLQIMQLGPDTHTEFSTFQLAGKRQLQDLHSSLVLSYPHGVSRQLHKCIVTDSTGHAVFDGNVRVNRYAQQTDAGQLSRSLLLAPRATVNVKPNLQIIADDVKCSHGAAISDLEEEQLFYFRARGIDAETARSALVFSFGAEVLQHLSYESLRKRVEALVKGSLAAEGLIDSSIPVGL
jgi:Fe-S cluster assembly protein SufD